MVVGGGTAGVIAAVQAARAGARTVLIEMTGQLGGTMTSGGVSAPAYFWSPLRQIIAGIGWELVGRCAALGGATIPDFTRRNPRRPSYHVGVDRYLYAVLAEEMCREAGVELLYHVCPQEITALDEQRWQVETFGKNLRQAFVVRELIDCTGDANVVEMLGLARTRDAERQPGTLAFSLSGYDLERLDADAIEEAYQQALADGRLQPGDFCYAHQPFIDFLRRHGFNQQHIFGADTTTAASMTAASLAGRAALLRLLRFVRTLPGCEAARIEYMADQATARDTWRIVGECSVTYDDYLAARVYPDAVAYTLYFIDVHTHDGTHHEFLPEDRVPTIPLGALIPRGSRRVLAAGRIIASDKLAHSALRVEASCMAMGQVVGAAAALGALSGRASRDVPLAELRALLRAHGAIVPE
jgi:hypothetical protein